MQVGYVLRAGRSVDIVTRALELQRCSCFARETFIGSRNSLPFRFIGKGLDFRTLIASERE